jgi:ubiquinone/menaquinone biosynthesis C-methylase UbiE
MSNVVSERHSQSFWDRLAPKYARKPIADIPAYERKLSRIASLLQPADRVLEIGCGTGGTALRLAPSVAHITATDISNRMIDIAKSKLASSAVENVTFRQAGAKDPVDESPFDAICAFSLLHLIENVPTVLNHIHRQLKPGGLFLCKTVCLKEGNFLIRMVVSVLQAVGYAPKITYFSTKEHLEQIQSAGFEIMQIDHLGANRMSPLIVARRAGA